MPHLRDHKGLVAGSMLALVASTLMRLPEPWPLKFVLDRVVTTRTGAGSGIPAADALAPTTLLALCAAGGVIALRALFQYLATVGFALVGTGACRARHAGSGGAHCAIAERAQAALAALPDGGVTGIHRDFYPDQVLLDGARVCIVDLDLFARGDPMIDLGNFIAYLAEEALRRHGDLSALQAHEAAFLAGYRSILPVDADRLAVHRRVSLARHIHISTRFADRRHTTLPLIEALS